MTALRFTLAVATLSTLFGASVGLGGDRIAWSSIERLLPGPKPAQGTLSPDDLAPWRSQAARQGGLRGIGFGDEKPWKLRGDRVTIVALQVPLAVGCKQGPLGFIVGIVDGSGKLVARSSELFSEGSNANEADLPYRIDTAAYRLSDSETAFGVRIAHYHSAKHWCYADQVLHLFRVVGKDVVRILSTDTFYEQVDQIELAQQDTPEALDQIENDPDCSFSRKTFPPKGQGAILRMLSTQTQGFYDIQLTQKGGGALTYRWDGQRYVADGRQPADRHLRAEWDWCTGRRYLADHGLPMPELPSAPSKH